jgi:hypothetical protein
MNPIILPNIVDVSQENESLAQHRINRENVSKVDRIAAVYEAIRAELSKHVDVLRGNTKSTSNSP